MKRNYLAIILLLLILNSCVKTNQEKVVRLTAKLSAFGVENDLFPTIDVDVDFLKNTGTARRSYYNPDIKSSNYSFSDNEIRILQKSIESTSLSKLKQEYTTNGRSDQPTSTLTIYTTQNTYTIKDYGLAGENPLPMIYASIYKIYNTNKQ